MVIELESLLDAWAQRSHHVGRQFARDGIIDDTRWNSTRPRVLFLLKEAYADESEGPAWDLCHHIRDKLMGPKGKMWNTVSQWAYLIMQGSHSSIVSYPEAYQDRPGRSQALLSSAVVNIKKSGGTSTSDIEDLKHFATLDADLIRKQVSIIDPDIVICGYTWPIAQEHVWTDAHQIYDLVYESDACLFCDFWHPANKYPDQLHYYALASVLSQSGALERIRPD